MSFKKMYSRINLKDIKKGHKSSFLNKKGEIPFIDKISYDYIPFLISFALVLIKIPNANLQNILAVFLSILIGLLLNVLVLLTSNISSEKLKIPSIQKELRLMLLKETFYNVSFSVVMSVRSIVVLFFMNLFVLDNKELINLGFILFNYNLNIIIQIFLGLFLYFFTIKSLLILFMILKRINKLFVSEIDIEQLNIEQLKKEESNQKEFASVLNKKQ